MKYLLFAAGVGLAGYLVWRGSKAARAGVSPIHAVLNPRLPLIAPQYRETRFGPGHFQ